MNSFHLQFTYYYANEDKKQEAMLSCVSKFLCRLIFSGYYLLKISFNQFLQVAIEICIFLNIHVHMQCVYTVHPLLDGTHLVALRGLIHQEVPGASTRRAQLNVIAKAVRPRDLLNHYVKT